MNNTLDTGGWLTIKASEVNADGSAITSAGFDFTAWMNATVPGTVLTNLIQNGIYPDPYVAENNDLIPDIYTAGRDFYTYWFRTTFELPAATAGQNAWLQFRGINYSADVFVNGSQITSTPIQGMFFRHVLDITSVANFGGVNSLAVIVYPVDHPGDVANGGQGGDEQIGRDVTAQYVEGWDWIIPIRDRNTGIWDQVSVITTGPVVINDPYVITSAIQFKGTTRIAESADLNISMEVRNVSTAMQSGTLKVVVGDVEQSQAVAIPAASSNQVQLNMTLTNPALWWPNGYGKQDLHTLTVSFEIDRQGVSHTQSLRFGIRQITSNTTGPSGGRIFFVNGQQIFIRGANWIIFDAMLRLSAERYRHDIRMHAQMNLNTIRVWGGSIAERPEFYDACDEYGLLVMQEFWMTGDVNGSWGTGTQHDPPSVRNKYPDDHALYLSCARDTVRMLRNHPSLCFWCGGNELIPTLPPPDIEKALSEDIIPNLDGTRLYIPSSISDGLGPGDGPYGILPDSAFFKGANVSTFNPEMGSVGTPVVETLRRFLSAAALKEFPVNQKWGAEWKLHTYIPYSNPNDGCPDQIASYGTPTNMTVDDFALRAQIVNYLQYRALFEGMNMSMWITYTGILVWKGQNPWTGLRGQFYDWYCDQTGGYYGTRKACEPLHVQLNWNNLKFGIVNCTDTALANVKVEYTVYHYLTGKQLSQQSVSVNQVNAHSTYVSSSAIVLPSDNLPIHFILMKLTDAGGKSLSENLYWRSAADPEDFTAFMQLAPVKLSGTVNVSNEGQEYVLIATVTNPASTVAFFIRLKVINPQAASGSDNRVLPTFYDDNYFTLMPGDKRTITMRCSQQDAGGADPQVWVEGYNVSASQL